ncbi:MAG: 3'-5' exonuclease, partial [bacterium]|nr:3'-5' exonuclease [bacterium]
LSDYEKNEEEPSLARFLDQITLSGGIDDYDPEKGVLPLMTLHLAKGLEFPFVFMVGLEEGIFPHQRSLDEEEGLEEERRLCYVGLTRAKKKIYLSHALKRRLYGGDQYNLPSRFLDEMPEELLERIEEIPSVPPLTKGGEGGFDDDDFDQRPPEERNTTTQSIYQVGRTVRHPLFGDGVIKKREGAGEQEKVIVFFKNGRMKTLMVKYAGLIIL